MSECCDEYGAERVRSSNGILLVANINVLRDSGSHRADGIYDSQRDRPREARNQIGQGTEQPLYSISRTHKRLRRSRVHGFTLMKARLTS